MKSAADHVKLQLTVKCNWHVPVTSGITYSPSLNVRCSAWRLAWWWFSSTSNSVTVTL